MVSGYGIIDPIVVVAVLLVSVYLLTASPQRLLPYLPTFLTIDFFIPFQSQLTPYRLVPLLLGGWLIFKGRLFVNPRYQIWLSASFSAILIAFLYALFIGDAGIRPWFRAAQYCGLIFVFVFVCQMITRWRDVETALWGLGLAGAVHGLYALYQLIASKTGLPFRGIVYDEGGEGAAVEVGVAGLIRVNGLADEPKRLGYVLLCGALAMLYFYWRTTTPNQGTRRTTSKTFAETWGPLCLFGICILMSLLTFSISYYAAAGMTFSLLATTLSGYAVAVPFFFLVILVGISFIAPELFDSYVQGLIELFDARTVEMDRGLDSQFVYRQEFYAQDYVANDWTVMLSGLGLGRYNKEFADRYGPGAGFTTDGQIKPLNSQFYEVGLDLGLLGLLVICVGTWSLLKRLGLKQRIDFLLSAMLLFMAIQSLFVNNLYMFSFVAATCASFLVIGREARRPGRPASTHGSRPQRIKNLGIKVPPE